MGFVTASKPLSILFLEPIPSTSHHIWAMNLIKGLLRNGHHVHVVSVQETKVDAKLAQNLTYAVSRHEIRRHSVSVNRLFIIYKPNKPNKPNKKNINRI